MASKPPRRNLILWPYYWHYRSPSKPRRKQENTERFDITCLCLCVCLCACMHACMRVCCLWVCMCMCMCACMYGWTDEWMHIHDLCIREYLCPCTNVHAMLHRLLVLFDIVKVFELGFTFCYCFIIIILFHNHHLVSWSSCFMIIILFHDLLVS